jgi:dephospho-CoA kinase
MPSLIIGLVGQAGCGKGTAADFLQKEYGAGYVRFSAILGSILDALALEKSREEFIRISEVLRKEFGEDVLSHAIARQVLMSDKDIIVIDGIRRLEDIVAFEPLPQFALVAIDAPAELRFERMKKRGEKATESTMTWEQFQHEEDAPTERTIPEVMARATVTFDNSGTQEALIEKIKAFMQNR